MARCRRESKTSSAELPAPFANRGRLFGRESESTAAAGDSIAPSTLFGPSLQVHSAFARQNNKRIVLALQSGLKSELTQALNALALISFKEKDEVQKDATPLAKIPGLLDALLQVIYDWRDINLPRVFTKTTRVRLLGTNSVVTRFGNEYETLNSGDSVLHPRLSTNTILNALEYSRFFL